MITAASPARLPGSNRIFGQAPVTVRLTASAAATTAAAAITAAVHVAILLVAVYEAFYVILSAKHTTVATAAHTTIATITAIATIATLSSALASSLWPLVIAHVHLDPPRVSMPRVPAHRFVIGSVLFEEVT